MSTKYIVRSEKGWEVKNAKAERATRIFDHQSMAIDYAAGIKGTKTIMVQNKEGKFRKLTGWDEAKSSNNVMHPEKNYEKPKRKKYSKWLYVIPYLLLIGAGVVIGLWLGGIF